MRSSATTTTPASTSEWIIDWAVRPSAFFSVGRPWLRRMMRPRVKQFPVGRERTSRIIPWVTLKREVFNHMFGRLGDDAPLDVKAFPPRSACDLTEVADREEDRLVAVEFAQLRKENRSNRDIDANAERIGAGNDLEQPFLGELFYQEAVAREEPRVVNADAVAEKTLQLTAVGALEMDAYQRLGDLLLLLFGADVDAHEVLRLFRTGALGEIHQIDRRFSRFEKVIDGLVKRSLFVGKVERDRAEVAPNGDGLAACQPREFLLKEGRIAESGAHEEELGLRQREQRDLPGPPAFAVRIVMKLVNNDGANVGSSPLGEADVRENFGGATDGPRLSIDARIAGRDTDPFRREQTDKIEELFVRQCLNRGRVVTALRASEGTEVGRQGDHALPRTGRRREDD
ncbi:hypothetical protein OUZ56_032676, partial [Daphnia magna]